MIKSGLTPVTMLLRKQLDSDVFAFHVVRANKWLMLLWLSGCRPVNQFFILYSFLGFFPVLLGKYTT